MDKRVPCIAVFAPDAHAMRWVREELSGATATIVSLDDVRSLIALIGDEANETRVVVIDFDGLRRSDLVDLSLVRRQTSGVFIGLGQVPTQVQRHLDLERVIERPLGSEALRKVIGEALERPRQRPRDTDVRPTVD